MNFAIALKALIFASAFFIINYLCGALISSHISMDFALTDWSNAWTYVWLFFGAAWLFVLFDLAVMAFALAVFVTFCVYEAVMEALK